MLLDGIQHVAVLTQDTARFVEFYTSMFGAEVGTAVEAGPGMRITLVHLGPSTEFNVFEITGNDVAHTPMFGRGPLDHIGLNAASLEAFTTIRERLMARGASSGFVTDFGPVLSLFFTDPDGLEAEVCVANPDAVPGVLNLPDTPSARFHP
jgi:catechol 2,3-dioxygenase-like lactoylglutathione lyase family enzyme